MVDYRFSYLIGDLVLLAIWLLLYILRKDLRKPMLFMSSFLAVVGLIPDVLFLKDWWHPLTITGTVIGIEDLLFGFCVAGIGSTIYEEVFKKRIRMRKPTKREEREENVRLLLLIFGSIALFFFLFKYSGLNSFYSSLIAAGISILVIWIKRPDLIWDSIATAILITVVSLPAYIIPELITPGWIKSAWYLEKISGIIFLNAPLEDIVWFFFAGLYLGPLYEFWREARLVNIKKRG